MTYRELDKILKQNGWEKDKKGNGSSHVMYRKNGKKIPVPNHGDKDIATGTLNSILKSAGLK